MTGETGQKPSGKSLVTPGPVTGSEENKTKLPSLERSRYVNPAVKHAEGLRDTSPMHRYILDEGQSVARHDIEHIEIAGRQVSVSSDVTDKERALIETAIQATRPSDKACYMNALQLWEFDDRMAYCEGVAALTDPDLGATEHAWVMLDSTKLVDVTHPFDYYHGVTISDSETLERHTGSELDAAGILGNHRSEFLRKRGYDYDQ